MSRSPPSLGVRVAPYLAVFSMGHVMFGYAGAPALFLRTYEIDYASFGLLMSATLLSFVFVQWPASELVERVSTTRILLGTTAAHAAIAVTLDLTPNYPVLLGLRFLWGIAAGMLLSVGATHIARLYEGKAASRQQGLLGGMLTLGGAVGFVLAPWFVTATDGLGVQAAGALFALPSVALLWYDRHDDSTAPTGTNRDGLLLSAAAHPTVILASLCYVAIISSYMTLSTFMTAYFDDLGVFGQLNALVLVTATAGRSVGAGAVSRLAVCDSHIIGVATALALTGFITLTTVSSGLLLVTLPFIIMLAVSVPFGAVYNVAANATASEGAALATVIAAGNIVALALPVITGMLRDLTGSFKPAFFLLALLNAVAVAAAILLKRY